MGKRMAIDHMILLNRIRQGDESTFEQVYNDYFSSLSVYATSILHDPEDAVEVVNDVFLNFWENHERIGNSIYMYLIRSVKNRSLNRIRDNSVRHKILEDYGKEWSICHDDQDDPLSGYDMKNLSLRIYELSDTLPDQCKKIFNMHFRLGLTTNEIAKILEISSSTVRVQISIALHKISSLLQELKFEHLQK